MNPILLVFTLLSNLRHTALPARITRKINPEITIKTSFWLNLCRQAHLLNQANHPGPTCYQWLGWSSVQQTRHLLSAWETSPRDRQNQKLRTRILRRLANKQRLRPSDARELPALQALGLCAGQNLTTWGETILNLRPAPSPAPPARWKIKNGFLLITHPVDWKLLWKLEIFISPHAPLVYRLDAVSLRKAAQRGEPQKLLEILQTGLGQLVPPEIRAQILGQPSLQTSTGLVLEFSDPAELRQLRRSEPLRSHFERILSPRHAFVEAKTAPRLLKLLERRGIYATPLHPPNLPVVEPVETRQIGGKPAGRGVGSVEAPVLSAVEARTHFSRAGLLEPLGNSLPLLEFIHQSMRQQLAFDMLYNAPNAERPEIHRITPLLIEERGGYTYVIAYSHTRHGQRTYRLDRMEVPGTIHPSK